MQLSARSGRIAVSPTMKVAADAMKMKAQGIDVVDFGAGEPDFATPAHIAALYSACLPPAVMIVSAGVYSMP